MWTQTNFTRLRLGALLGIGISLAVPACGQAQEETGEVPTTIMGSMPSDPALQAEIDKVLGMTEWTIQQGIVDPGVDVATLMINKALDELIKTIADAAVLAPAAEKIMSAYQKTKEKRLVKKLASLRAVWQDGQERLNKLNYQDFKLRYTWAKQHNDETASIQASPIKGLESQLTKDIWNTQVAAINQTYDHQGPLQRMIHTYLDRGRDDLAYYNLVVINGTLGVTSLIKARNAVAAAKGKPVFLSPYARLKLQQQSLAEARQRHADLISYGRRVAAAVNYYRLAESEQAMRGMLSKRIADPYMIRYTRRN